MCFWTGVSQKIYFLSAKRLLERQKTQLLLKIIQSQICFAAAFFKSIVIILILKALDKYIKNISILLSWGEREMAVTLETLSAFAEI